MAAYLLIIAVAFSVVAVSLMNLVSDYLVDQQAKDDRRVAQNIAGALTHDFVARDAVSLYEGALSCAESGDGRVLVLDGLGVVQIDTMSELNGTRFANAEAAAVLSGASEVTGGIYESGQRATWGQSILDSISGSVLMSGVFAAAMTADDGVVGAVIFISQADEIYEGLNHIRLRMFLWLVIIALIALILSVFFARMITRPIGDLNEGISRMSSGDLSSRVNVRGKNEFAQLARAFNSMSERIEALDNSRGQFVSNASHELKTPLSTMKILLESILYQENNDPVMEKEFLGDINKEIDRLSRIVSDLLTLVNMDSGGVKLALEDIRVGAVVQEQTQRLLPLAREHGIELSCAVRDACETQGDATKLQQVFYNVIDNAIKYTPRGGSVSVEVARAGKKAIVKIADTGIGIPETDLAHIFDRFYRVDKARSRETGGTGLGLSIVKQTLLLHNGDIRAQSKEGAGTTFTIELPIVKQGGANA